MEVVTIQMMRMRLINKMISMEVVTIQMMRLTLGIWQKRIMCVDLRNHQKGEDLSKLIVK